MAQFHTDEYVDFLSRVTPDLVEAAAEGGGGGRAGGIGREMGKCAYFDPREGRADQSSVNVGDDCPVFDGLFEYCSISAGGSMGTSTGIQLDGADRGYVCRGSCSFVPRQM